MSIISRKKLKNCQYPCKDIRKYIIALILLVGGGLYLAILIKDIRLHGISIETVKQIIFMCMVLTSISFLALATCIISDYCFLAKAIMYIKNGQGFIIWELLRNKRGTRLHWLILKEPINCLLVGKLFEEAGINKNEKEYVCLATQMITLAVEHDPRLNELAKHGTAREIAELYDVYRIPQKNIFQRIYSLWNIPIIKVTCIIIAILIFLLSILLQLVKIISHY